MERVDVEMLAGLSVVVGSDSDFQQHARLAQAVWREHRGYPLGLHRGEPLGSRLAMPWAQEHLAAFLSPAIRRRVHLDVLHGDRDRAKLFATPRIFDDLLSSQPLCFNAFAELADDRHLAARVGQRLWPNLVHSVDRIEFEWSPGRASTSYLNNKSAFDVAWFVRDRRGDRALIGIEVKYHENMRVSVSRHQDLYDTVSSGTNVFLPDPERHLRRPPLQQLWLDHLLALTMTRADPDLKTVRFVLCAPAANAACSAVATRYEALLRDPATFERLALDQLADILVEEGVPSAHELRSRYLPWNLPNYTPGRWPASPSR